MAFVKLRLRVIIGAIIAACLAAAPLPADADDPSGAETFKLACMPGCGAQGHQPGYCSKLCACSAAEMQKKLGDDAFSRKPAPGAGTEQILGIMSMCSGRYLDEYFEAVTSQQCGADADCREGSACLVSELKTLGSESEIGAVLAAMQLKQTTGGGDSQKVAVYNRMRYTCTGRIALRTTSATCVLQCGGEPDCMKSCACLGNTLRTLGTETQIGEMITKYGEGDAASVAKYEDILAGCGLAAQ